MINFIEFSSLYELQSAFPTEEICIKFFERLRWNGTVVSPFDETSTVYKCGNGKYKCSNSNRYFTVKTGTLMEGSKLPFKKWLMAFYIMGTHKKGISSIQLSKMLSVTQYTAWKLQTKIREAMSEKGYSKKLEGVVECDETFVGGKFKSRRRLHYKKEMGKEVSPVINKAVVFGMIQRGGKVVIRHVPDTRRETLIPYIRKHVKEGSVVMTDEHYAYQGLNRKYQHGTVNHSAHEYSRGIISTNTIENVWSTLKRSLYGTHQWTSRKHLQKYLNEFQFRFNNREECDYNRVIMLMNNAFICRPTG